MNVRYSLLLILIVQSVGVYAQGFASGTGPSSRLEPAIAAEPVPEDVNWDDRFGPVGTDGEIKAMAVSGDDIYIGGSFHRAGGVRTAGIARWNATSRKWYGIGSDLDVFDGTIASIAIAGGKLYVGGQFTAIGAIKVHNLAVYDMASARWSAWGDGAGGGQFGGYVASLLAVGSDVYVGGQFTTIGTILANNIARWDGSRFHKLGGGLGSAVSAMTYAGGKLYAGGDFVTAGEASAGHVAGWDGQSWLRFGAGTNGSVRALAVDGGYLYAGGIFDSAGGAPVRNVARYDLNSGRWSNMGGGVQEIDPTQRGMVNAIQPVGGKVYVAGKFRLAGEIDTVRHLAIWDGARMRGVRKDTTEINSHGLGVGGATLVNAMALVAGDLYLVGVFQAAYDEVTWSAGPHHGTDPAGGGVYAYNIVRWGPSDRSWHPVGTSPDNSVHQVLIDGDTVYFAGEFRSIGGIAANMMARWNSRTREWSDFGTGLEGLPTHIYDVPIHLASYRGELYAASYNALYRRDRQSNLWKKLAGSLHGAWIYGLTVGDAGIFAGGAGGVYRLGSFDWELIDTLGIHLANAPSNIFVNPYVPAIALDGDRLYIGGMFTIVGNTPVHNAAFLDLKTGEWSPMGNDSPGYGYDDVISDIRIDGQRVYAGGKFVFDQSGQRRYNHVAEWDKSTGAWSPLGEGMNNPVNSLDLRDGMLYAGGQFTLAGDVGAAHVAMWDGEVWSTLGSGTDGSVLSVAAGNNQVIVAGAFEQAGWKPSYLIGRWSDQSLSVPVAGLDARQQRGIAIAPNPCSTVASVTFSVTPATGKWARLLLYDALGNVVAPLYDGPIEPGEQTFPIDVSRLATGLYYCKLQQGEQVSAQPIVVER